MTDGLHLGLRKKIKNYSQMFRGCELMYLEAPWHKAVPPQPWRGKSPSRLRLDATVGNQRNKKLEVMSEVSFWQIRLVFFLWYRVTWAGFQPDLYPPQHARAEDVHSSVDLVGYEHLRLLDEAVNASGLSLVHHHTVLWWLLYFSYLNRMRRGSFQTRNS